MTTRTNGARAGVALSLGAGLVLAAIVPAAAHGHSAHAPSSNEDLSTEDRITETVEAMSIDELIGQMTWTRVYGDSADDDSMAAENQQYYGVDTPAEVIEKYDLGGVLYFA